MLKPLFTKIAVKRDTPQLQTEAGIIVPEGAQKPMNTGTVIAVGEGLLCPSCVIQGQMCHVEPLRVKVGDRILFNVFAGNEVEYTPDGATESETLLIMDQDEVVALL